MSMLCWNFGGGGGYLTPFLCFLPHCKKKKKFYTSDMKHHLKSIKKGFTLAEVLITLGVIGIVAALTLPSVIAKYKNIQYVSMLKKNYTEISQVLVQIEAENGPILELLNEISPNDFMKDYLYPKLNGAKFYEKQGSFFYAASMCGNSTWAGYYWRGAKPQLMTAGGFPSTPANSVMLNNGTCFIIWNNNGLNHITMDINGPNRGPNTMGYDVHKFYVTDNGLKPDGYNKSITNIISNCPDSPNDITSAGDYCTARIVQDGWQMKYR